MAAILFLADGPKSIASVILVIWYHISNLKSIGETVLKVSRSQVGRTEGQTDRQTHGRLEWRKNGPTDGRTSFAEDKNVLLFVTKLCHIFYPFSETTYQKSFIYLVCHWEKKCNKSLTCIRRTKRHFTFILLACYFTPTFTIQSISTGINDYEYDPTFKL